MLWAARTEGAQNRASRAPPRGQLKELVARRTRRVRAIRLEQIQAVLKRGKNGHIAQANKAVLLRTNRKSYFPL